MWIAKFPRIAGSIAAAWLVLALAACGGSSSHSNVTTTSLSQYSSEYAGAISDFMSGGGHVQGVVETQSGSGGYTFDVPTSFVSNVLPNISGVAVSLSWSDIESSNDSGTGSGGYDFTAYDAAIAPYVNSGKTVNLIVWPATEGGNNTPGSGGSTPAYVFSSVYAERVGAPNPQDMTVCPNYTGDSSNPFAAQVASGGGGVWNIDTSTDLSGLPVSYELPFMTAYKAFIAQVIAWYSTPGHPKIGYIRFGFSQGGENSPECNMYWPNFSGTVNGQPTYLNYIQEMTTFVQQQVQQQGPSMTILEDLHALGTVGTSGYGQYPDQEAADAVAAGFGFGTNGLQLNDTEGGQCDSDWCNLFAQYHTDFNGQSNITLSLQTLQWTDPTNQSQTGSLTVLEPFAKAGYANNLELYPADVGLAFDLSNYCGYPHNLCSTLQ